MREPPRPAYLDAAEQIEALLEAATQLDRDPSFRCSDRRAIIATFAPAGLRAEELGGLLWRHVDLANGRIRIENSKTEAGLREVDLVPLLRDTLLVHRDDAPYTAPGDPVFPTRTGGRRDKDNLRFRVLAPALRHANELMIQRGRQPLPEGISPHKLRHTFASMLIACGEDPVSVTYRWSRRPGVHAAGLRPHDAAGLLRARKAEDDGRWQHLTSVSTSVPSGP